MHDPLQCNHVRDTSLLHPAGSVQCDWGHPACMTPYSAITCGTPLYCTQLVQCNDWDHPACMTPYSAITCGTPLYCTQLVQCNDWGHPACMTPYSAITWTPLYCAQLVQCDDLALQVTCNPLKLGGGGGGGGFWLGRYIQSHREVSLQFTCTLMAIVHNLDGVHSIEDVHAT